MSFTAMPICSTFIILLINSCTCGIQTYKTSLDQDIGMAIFDIYYMNHQTSSVLFKSIGAVILSIGVVGIAFGQRDTKSKFVLKDRFISSAGFFYSQPANLSNVSY